MIDGRMITAFLAAVSVMTMACGEDKREVLLNNGGNTPIGTANPKPDMADMADLGADMGPDAAMSAGEFVPTEPGLLFKYLKDGAYETLEDKNSEVFASDGPHGFQRTYLNSALSESRAAGGQVHPVGVAAIKELYERDKTTLKGWAVQVKVETESDGGQGWYWYEILNVTDGSNPDYDGRGVSLCVNCHASGNDYIRSPIPLE